LFAEKEAYRVSTVLGSCIAICLYDTKLKIGGINHYMLPLWNGQGLASPKYGNIANEKLLNRMLELNCKRENIVAKVFGGANQTMTNLNIGGRNTEVAFDFLKAEKIKVVANSVGGPIGRKMIFDTHTSGVMMKYVKSKDKY
jgi:chemotaxis protein CheD